MPNGVHYMTDQAMLQVIMEDIKTLIGREGSHAAEINQLKEDVKPIKSLVAWRNRWGGAVVALSFMGSLLGAIAIMKGLF